MIPIPYIPEYTYCIMCGKECLSETCGKIHRKKLKKIRSVITDQQEREQGKRLPWNPKTIRIYNSLQDLISEKDG